MKIRETELPGVLTIAPQVFEDQRGFFFESWNKLRYRDAGFPAVEFTQSNHSRSSRNVLRGLHYQLDRPQGKLLQVTSGKILDVAVDIRLGSPTFGHWVAYELDDTSHQQLYVPPGFAHGFYVISAMADVVYQCTTEYDARSDAGIRFDDPELGIEWPNANPVLSNKDSCLPTLGEARQSERLPKFCD